jgi:hypothetical protein
MAIIWNTPAGSLGTVSERVKQDISLSATSSAGSVNFELQSGILPKGLRIQDGHILGTPLEVSQSTTTRFVIRATDGQDKKDRTFALTVEGANNPFWETAEGLLPVGPNFTYFILDNDKVDFQLVALDSDIPAGDTIEYFIPYNGGELPPGLTLSKTGRISGFTKPIFALDNKIYTGNYDKNLYDSEPYDLGVQPINGFDSFKFDQVGFDYSDVANFPKRLTRFYQFSVIASDGLHEDRRTFKIYVVSEDFLRSDNTIMQVGTGIFRADNTFVRAPIWTTEPNLGTRRANNYVTVYLDVFQPDSWPGIITYRLNEINPVSRARSVGLTRDTETSITVKMLPNDKGIYPMPNKTLLMSVYDVSTFTDSTLGTYTITNVDKVGTNTYKLDVFPSINGRIKSNSEILFGSTSKIPPGLSLDTITGELTGIVPYQPRITENYEFTVIATTTYPAGQQASTPRTFKISTIGEIESGIEWVSNADLGTISPNKDSRLTIKAKSLLRGGQVVFEIVKGKLPSGLSLLSTGEIIGKVNQIGDAATPGVTRFYDVINGSRFYGLTYDSGLTVYDRDQTFVVAAKDIYNYTESTKTFKITVSGIADIIFSNLSFRVLQKKEKRNKWYDFISNIDIFPPEKIYRYGDPAFGMQDSLTMLMFAGIKSSNINVFVEALSRNHYHKRLKFGKLKKAIAKDETTQEVIYEIVYIDVIDSLIKNNKSISARVELDNRSNKPILVDQDHISADSNNFLASDKDLQIIWPNSIKNMRKRIKDTGLRDRSYLPLWMRSIQENNFVEPGFVSAMPICYTKPGKADEIILRIQDLSDFDFKTINFEVDRYIIDSIDGVLGDQYLAFPTGIAQDKDPVPEANTFNLDSVRYYFDTNLLQFDRGPQ